MPPRPSRQTMTSSRSSVDDRPIANHDDVHIGCGEDMASFSVVTGQIPTELREGLERDFTPAEIAVIFTRIQQHADVRVTTRLSAHSDGRIQRKQRHWATSLMRADAASACTQSRRRAEDAACGLCVGLLIGATAGILGSLSAIGAL